MLMRMMKEGGIPLYYSENREAAMRKKRAAYNPKGFYEPEPDQWRSYCFSDTIPDGHAVKIMTEWLPLLGTEPTTVFWIDRDPEEIRQSYLEMYSQDLAKRFKTWPNYYHHQREDVGKILSDRRSVKVVEINFYECVKSALQSARMIAEHCPIDPVKAASVIEPFYPEEMKRVG